MKQKDTRNATLEMPHVLAVAEGTFMQWMRERGKVGGQNKVPRLSNNRDYLDSLLRIHLSRINENIQNKSIQVMKKSKLQQCILP